MPEPRGPQTQALIVDTALRLFRERGYDETTMRAVATEAGVSVGNAYYYFASKEHLVQEFYLRLQTEHTAAAQPVLERESDFGARLRGVLHVWLDVAGPYHAFAGQFFKIAAEPTSPLSPFSPESSPSRDAAIELMGTVLDGSSAKADPELRADLPELLWLMTLGIVLYWVHDRSAQQANTRTLIDRAVPLVDRLVNLSRLRIMRPVTRDVVGLARLLRGDPPPAQE
jgi:AcrR family transcriptional regulator